MKLNQLPIDQNDLTKVSNFLAPHYGISGEQKAAQITNTINTTNTELSIETGGFIACNLENKVRIFLGNHLIGCEVIKIARPNKKFKTKKVKTGIPLFLPHK